MAKLIQPFEVNLKWLEARDHPVGILNRDGSQEGGGVNDFRGHHPLRHRLAHDPRCHMLPAVYALDRVYISSIPLAVICSSPATSVAYESPRF